jgi:sulfhydrogenase subunit beta (sulfur reductase)
MRANPAKLEKRDFQAFLQDVAEKYDLFAPVRMAEGVSVYKKIDDPGEVDLSHSNPQKPVKEVFFSQSEVMFRYEKIENRSRVTSTEEVKRERVVLGARPCDIRAISLLDQVFSGKEYTDVYYLQKRRMTIVIGLACNHPLTTCFCSSVGGGPFAREGSDVFMVDLGESYLVEFLTEKGEALSQNRFLKGADEKDFAMVRALEEKASIKADASLSLDGIDRKLDEMAESPFWEKAQEKCLGCRVCTYLCPTCHCFDIADEARTNKGQRVRNWDSCLSTLYSLETSGHNPRPTGRERTRQRIMHKFNYFPKNVGKIACVGCGRCIIHCPANSDIRQTLKEISAK